MELYLPDFAYQNGAIEKGTAVAVENGRIVETGPAEALREKYPSAEKKDWAGLVLVPGTVNAHNHCFQSLLRGIATDRPFLEWRDEALYRYSQRFSPEDIYTGALFAFGEMLKCGVTTVCDFFYLHNFGTESDEQILRAAHDLGIRLVLARTMYDWTGAPAGYVETIEDAVENTRALAKKYNGSGMATVLPAPHSLHAASLDMVRAGHALAKELGTCFHIHVAEEPFEVEQVKKEYGGLTPLEVLDKAGVLDERTVIVHGVWLQKSEIERLGAAGGKLAYCPSSNMFLADGITDIPAMRKAGVLIGLGSDGACSNNRISVFEEMRMAALLQKANTCDALCLTYKDAFAMGTENGGELLGLPVGKLEAGYLADFVGVRLSDLSMQPVSPSGEQILPNLVYAMQPTAIAHVVVNGRQVVENGALLTVSEQKLVSKIARTMAHLRGEA